MIIADDLNSFTKLNSEGTISTYYAILSLFNN